MLKIRLVEVPVLDIVMEAVETLPEKSGSAAPDAQTVVCAHGFPDNLRSFDLILPALVSAGFRVLSVGLPGYSPKALIPGGDYSLANVGRYMLAFLDALDLPAVYFVGHDYGAIFAADMVAMQPDRIRKLALLSFYPPYKCRENLLRNPRQFSDFWYVQMITSGAGWIEEAMPVADYSLLDVIWHRWCPGWKYPQKMMDEVKATFRQEGVAAAALSYYHRIGRAPAETARIENLEYPMPTLTVGGLNDGCVSAGMFKTCDTSRYTGKFKLVMLESGHFPQRENPQALCAELLPFLTEADY
jgi:pimeloyl-ACP methyl ester carboxylesterase